jgi:hypothetical protein
MENREDLKMFVTSYLPSSLGRNEIPIETIVDFYLTARKEAATNLTGFSLSLSLSYIYIR